MTTPAHDRLNACHRAVDAAHSRLADARVASGRHPLDLLSEPTEEERAAERAFEEAHAGLRAELAAGDAERDAEWLALQNHEVTP